MLPQTPLELAGTVLVKLAAVVLLPYLLPELPFHRTVPTWYHKFPAPQLVPTSESHSRSEIAVQGHLVPLVVTLQPIGISIYAFKG